TWGMAEPSVCIRWARLAAGPFHVATSISVEPYRRSTVIPRPSAAATRAGGARPPAAAEAAEVVPAARAPAGRLDQVLEEGRGRQGVAAPLALDQLDRQAGVPLVLQHQLQPVVQRKPHAVVESGRVPD